MENKKFGAFSSSADPQKLAATWKGVLLGLIPVALMVLQSFDVNVAESDLAQLVEVLFGVVSALMVLFGLGRKIWLSR